jgi:hypothetical protein
MQHSAIFSVLFEGMAQSGPEQSPEVMALVGHLVGHELQRFAARAKIVLAAIESGDAIAYDLMVGLAGELAVVEEAADEAAAAIGPNRRLL